MDGYGRGKRTDRNTQAKQARELFGIKPGDTLLLLGDETRGIAIPPKGTFSELFQMMFDSGETKK